MIIEVVHTQWAAEETVFQGGVHELGSDECSCGVKHGKPDAEMLRLIAGAEAAGAVNVVDATAAHRAKLDKAVQSQEDGEAAWERAHAAGRWQHGNLSQFVVDRESQLAAALADKSLTRDEKAAKVDQLEGELADARALLAETEVPE